MHAAPPQTVRRLSLQATGGELFGIYAINLFFTILTLGVYYFWGKTRVRRYLLSQTEFDGDRFEWHGTGKELFIGFLKALIVPRPDRCRDAEQQRALERIAAVLLAPASGTPYTMQITVADNRDVNGVAAPGGSVVIFRGLLEETARPEELAGVMAHEIQHILHRHGTRAVFREMSLGLLLRIATGGSGLPSLDVARAVGGLRYRRGDEEAADRDGMAMVQRARIDPQGMVAMYERLQRRPERRGEPPTYLSSHPRTAERLASLKRQAAEARYTPVALLPGRRWSHIRARCK